MPTVWAPWPGQRKATFAIGASRVRGTQYQVRSTESETSTECGVRSTEYAVPSRRHQLSGTHQPSTEWESRMKVRVSVAHYSVPSARSSSAFTTTTRCPRNWRWLLSTEYSILRTQYAHAVGTGTTTVSFSSSSTISSFSLARA